MLFICETIEHKKKLIPAVVHNDGTAKSSIRFGEK